MYLLWILLSPDDIPTVILYASLAVYSSVSWFFLDDRSVLFLGITAQTTIVALPAEIPPPPTWHGAHVSAFQKIIL